MHDSNLNYKIDNLFLINEYMHGSFQTYPDITDHIHNVVFLLLHATIQQVIAQTMLLKHQLSHQIDDYSI